MAMVEKTTKLQKTYIEVLGLCCASEVPLVESILNSLPGIKDHKVIVPTRTVIVVHDSLIVSQLQIVKALNQARLEANVRLKGSTNFEKKWPSPYATVSGVLLALSFLKYAYSPFRWVALGAVAVGIFPMLLKAYASAKNLRLDANILMLIAAIGTVTLGDYTEAGTIVFLFCIAEWLESRAGHKAQAVMSSLMSIAPQKAVIAETGEEVDVDEVKLNTVLVVKAGEVIPIDAIVVDGMCEVDEKSLTGESYPVTKEKDSTVWAGTINLNGYVTVKTTALAEDCVVAKMTKLVEEAQNSKSATQRFIDKCAMYYTPAVIVLSGGLAVVPLALRLHNRSHWFHLALVVLVSACPCALILSTPVATFCALTKAATAGLLIKGGDYLETLAKIKVIAFDKTGTLTRGEFVVNDFVSLSHDISSDALLYWASSIESKSSHPMAAAIVDYARTCSVEAQPENVDEFQNYPGEGIHGRIDGHSVYIGNKRIAVRAGSETVPSIDAQMAKGKTIGFIYVQGRAVGVFGLSDVCRTGVKEALNKLISLNIKSVMLTGDSQSAAIQTQEELGHGLNAVHSELLPEDKAAIIELLKKEGPTAMVGDGINDAPALATADIGISMGISGSALATETGQVILMSNDLRKVPTAIKLARKAHRKVIENVFISITAKAGILALAIAGHPLVWAAVLADVGTCILVIMNSMLLLQGTESHDGNCCKLSDVLRGHKDSNNEPSGNRKNCCAEKKVANVPVSNSCCKSGSCSKNSDKQQQYQTEVDGSDKGVSNELEADNLKHHEDVPVVSSCCKSKSCRKNDLLDSTKKHQDQNAVCKSDKEKPCHDGSFQKDNDDLEASIPKQNDEVPIRTSCCKSKTCKKSDNSDSNGKQVFNGSFQMLDRDMEANNPKHREDVRVGTPCCKSKSCMKNELSNTAKSLPDPDQITVDIHPSPNSGMKHACSSPGKREMGTPCCKSKSCTKNELSNTAKSLPDPDQITVDIHPSPNSGMKHACSSPGKREMGTPCCKSKSCTKNKLSNTAKSLPDPDQITVDIHPSPNSGMKHACSSPGKREMEGCCKSYMKECCSKHVHLTNCGIVGGLTEIVTE